MLIYPPALSSRPVLNNSFIHSRKPMTKRPLLSLSICLTLAALVATALLLYTSGPDLANAALAEYQIDKMTCGSCIGNIEKTLSRLAGIGAVEVNLTSGRGRVTYDPDTIDSKSIGEAISGAGYPASLRLELDAREFAALRQRQSELGQKYLAQVGSRLLARADFEELVRQRSAGAAAGQVDRAWKAAWEDVLQRELLLVAAEQNQVVIQDGEVDARLEELRQAHRELERAVTARYGSMAKFRERLREDMIIKRNMEDHVYPGISDPSKRQARLQSWYDDLRKNTEVIIFDPRLKSLDQGGGGCGGCCNS
jgi:copper chaperone CopZ